MNQKVATTRVSVVMCTYNGERYLREQLDSIVNQTYPLHELLIFDDVSKDGTMKLLEEYVSQYPFIRIHQNKVNLGFTKNFEQALKAAQGDCIAIADQDDVWFLEKIEQMMQEWDSAHPLIYCNSFKFKGEVPKTFTKPVFRMFQGDDARKIFLTNTISGHNIIFRRDFLQKVLPFNEDAMYDWWMAVVAAYNGGVQHCDKVLVYHRNHEQNATVDTLNIYGKNERNRIEKTKILKQCRVFARAPGMLPEHKVFALTFARLLEESLEVKFHTPLFLFMVTNRKLLFNNKKKKIAIFSHIKHSYRRTKNSVD